MHPFQGRQSTEIPEYLRELSIHWYFVSRLLILHNPPIEPHWANPNKDNPFPDLCMNPLVNPPGTGAESNNQAPYSSSHSSHVPLTGYGAVNFHGFQGEPSNPVAQNTQVSKKHTWSIKFF